MSFLLSATESSFSQIQKRTKKHELLTLRNGIIFRVGFKKQRNLTELLALSNGIIIRVGFRKIKKT